MGASAERESGNEWTIDFHELGPRLLVLAVTNAQEQGWASHVCPVSRIRGDFTSNIPNGVRFRDGYLEICYIRMGWLVYFRFVEKTIGTVMQTHPYRETSLLVQWSTQTHGIIRTVAKGARRPKSGFAGKLDLFFKVEFGFVPSRSSSLHTLTEVALLDPRIGLRQSYLQTLAASYFTKLLALVSEEETPLGDLAGLLERGLGYLATQRPTRRAVLFFEGEAANLLGLGDRGLEGIGELYGRIPSIRKELLQKVGS